MMGVRGNLEKVDTTPHHGYPPGCMEGARRYAYSREHNSGFLLKVNTGRLVLTSLRLTIHRFIRRLAWVTDTERLSGDRSNGMSVAQ